MIEIIKKQWHPKQFKIVQVYLIFLTKPLWTGSPQICLAD